MTPFDMHYETDILFSADMELARLLAKPRPSQTVTPAHTARPLTAPRPMASSGETITNPAALHLAIAAERAPASRMERLVQALDAHSLATTISVVAVYLALINAA